MYLCGTWNDVSGFAIQALSTRPCGPSSLAAPALTRRTEAAQTAQFDRLQVKARGDAMLHGKTQVQDSTMLPKSYLGYQYKPRKRKKDDLHGDTANTRSPTPNLPVASPRSIAPWMPLAYKSRWEVYIMFRRFVWWSCRGVGRGVPPGIVAPELGGVGDGC